MHTDSDNEPGNVEPWNTLLELFKFDVQKITVCNEQAASWCSMGGGRWGLCSLRRSSRSKPQAHVRAGFTVKAALKANL
jgi:hypothetical protein